MGRAQMLNEHVKFAPKREKVYKNRIGHL